MVDILLQLIIYSFLGCDGGFFRRNVDDFYVGIFYKLAHGEAV